MTDETERLRSEASAAACVLEVHGYEQAAHIMRELASLAAENERLLKLYQSAQSVIVANEQRIAELEAKVNRRDMKIDDLMERDEQRVLQIRRLQSANQILQEKLPEKRRD